MRCSRLFLDILNWVSNVYSNVDKKAHHFIGLDQFLDVLWSGLKYEFKSRMEDFMLILRVLVQEKKWVGYLYKSYANELGAI